MHWFVKLFFILFALFLSWTFLAQVFPRIVPAEKISNRDVNGIILRNEEWSGTVHIVGDLVSTPGVTVTVDPGTRVIISWNGDRSNFDYLPWHLKSGLNTGSTYHGVRNGELFWDETQKIQIHLSKFVAVGTLQQPIVITSNAAPNLATPFDFNVFSFDSGILSNAVVSNYRRMEIGNSVTIRNSTFSNTGDCAICIDHGSPTIINNTFAQGVRTYIWDFGEDPRITDNLFLQSKGSGIEVDPDGDGAPEISHNDFEMPKSLAVEFLTGDEGVGGVLSYNVFAGSSMIEIPCDTKLSIVQNDIRALLTFRMGGCSRTVTLGSNFWNVDSPKTVLSERILNQDDKLTVSVPAILTSPPVGVGIRH